MIIPTRTSSDATVVEYVQRAARRTPAAAATAAPANTPCTAAASPCAPPLWAQIDTCCLERRRTDAATGAASLPTRPCDDRHSLKLGKRSAR